MTFLSCRIRAFEKLNSAPNEVNWFVKNVAFYFVTAEGDLHVAQRELRRGRRQHVPIRLLARVSALVSAKWLMHSFSCMLKIGLKMKSKKLN